MSILRPLLLTLLLLPLASLAAEPTTAPAAKPTPRTDTAAVEMRIVGPDGKPVARSTVHLSAHVSPTTDHQGVARFQWGLGKSHITVDVPGVGYGITGVLIPAAGKTTVAALPPLVPYGIVHGTVPGGAGATIATVDDDDKYHPVAVADADGRFECSLQDGSWHFAAMRDAKIFARPTHGILIRPGDRVDPLLFFKIPPKNPDATQPAYQEPAQRNVAWAHGTVRDSAGHPIAGATIYGAVFFNDGHGNAMTALAVTSDKQGHYSVKGPDMFGDFPVFVVVATAPRLPPAFAGEQGLGTALAGDGTERNLFPKDAIDVVLAPHGGSLDIGVFLAGHGLPGATVHVSYGGLMDVTFIDGPETQSGNTLYDLFNPTAKTGANGTAHFSALLPGRYDVQMKTDAIPNDIVRDNAWISSPVPIGGAEDIAVQAGRTTIRRLNMFEWPMSPQEFKVHRHDGRPLVGLCSFDDGEVHSIEEGANARITCDAAGSAQRQFNEFGIRRISFIYGITPECDSDSSQSYLLPPYYAATAFVGVSPRLDPKIPVKATAKRVNAANIFVQLLDTAGKPIRGFVKIGLVNYSAGQTGTTDAQGRLAFQQVATWPNYDNEIEAWAADPQLRDPLMPDPPPPADADLTSRVFFPSRQFKILPTGDVHLTLQAQPAGFVHGRVAPPLGHRPAGYSVTTSDPDSTVNYDPTTGQFIAGPFPPGRTILHIVPPEGNVLPLDWPCAIQAGRVMVLPAPIRPPLHAQTAPSPFSVLPPVPVRILQSDGKTPVYGGTLQFVEPDQPWYPDSSGNSAVSAPSDARGMLLEEWGSDTSNPPTRQYLLAMQPGRCGGAIVDVTHQKSLPANIVLPPPISVAGTLTLAGKPLTNQTGQFRVLAEFQDWGKLNAILSISATPQPDGSFDFSGLTPGTYKIQASLDNIWLSDTITLTVSADKPQLPPIHLDIPQPGGPAAIHCTDHSGKPLIGAQVVVDRPPGPLTDLDWPKEFTTDGAGDAWIPAIEAGKHTARLKDNAASVDFLVPALPATGAVVVQLAEK